MASPAALAEELDRVLGGSLRCVATYDGDDHDIAFLREDVEPKADADRVERIHEELVLGAIGGEYQEQLFDLGSLRATARHFEEGVVLHVAAEPYSGVFVSIDAEAADRAPAAIDACRGYLRDRPADDRPLLRGAN